jgi:hypothetical protein
MHGETVKFENIIKIYNVEIKIKIKITVAIKDMGLMQWIGLKTFHDT